MLTPSSWPFCASAHGSQGKLSLLSRPSVRLPPLHPAARGLGRAQKVPAACPGGPAPTLDQKAPCIISSSSPGSGRRRCGDQLGPWSGDPVQGSTPNNHQCALSQAPVLSQPQFPRGSNGVTASLPQGPGCSRASGVNRPAEGGRPAGPVLQPSVHRPPRRPPFSSPWALSPNAAVRAPRWVPSSWGEGQLVSLSPSSATQAYLHSCVDGVQRFLPNPTGQTYVE